MKGIVIFCGNENWHRYFVLEIASRFPVSRVFVDLQFAPRRRFKRFLKATGWNPLRLGRDIGLKALLLPSQTRDAKTMQAHFPHLSFPLDLPITYCEDLHSESVVEEFRKSAPEVALVFGTRILKEPLISVPKAMFNLHTGLSPYYRGGQATFWCLYNEEIEYVGVTVHWIDPGIDRGDIVYSARPSIEATDTLRDIECKCVKLGTELMGKAVEDFFQGCVKRVPQWEKGRLYLDRQFTLEKRWELEKKLRKGLIPRLLKGAKGKGNLPRTVGN